jgi:protease I
MARRCDARFPASGHTVTNGRQQGSSGGDGTMSERGTDGTTLPLEGMTVVVLAGEGVEDLEYWVTVMRLREGGAHVVSAGTSLEPARGKNGLAVRAEVHVKDLEPVSVDAVVIPGGWLPDKLRRHPEVTALVRAVHDAGRPIGIICHGGLIAISAGIVGRDHPVTGSLGIRDDLVNAGGRWVDEAAFRDGNQVWGRVVEDIPAFERELVALLAEHNAARGGAR